MKKFLFVFVLACFLPLTASAQNSTTIGCDLQTAASTNATPCRSGQTALAGYEIFNTNTTLYYLRLYNIAGTPTCSSATGFIRSIPIPPAAAVGGVGGAVIVKVAPNGDYTAGVGFCVTANATSNDNNAAATGIIIHLDLQ